MNRHEDWALERDTSSVSDGRYELVARSLPSRPIAATWRPVSRRIYE